MALKVQGKSWECNNQCKSNCCSELFLPLDSEQHTSVLMNGHFIAHPNYTDWEWLGYHDSVKIEKTRVHGRRKILVLRPFVVKYNNTINKYMLYIEDKCVKLMPDGRCRIYKKRPEICKKGECVVFSIKKKIQWYAENGLLKDKLEAYRNGKLSKW